MQSKGSLGGSNKQILRVKAMENNMSTSLKKRRSILKNGAGYKSPLPLPPQTSIAGNWKKLVEWTGKGNLLSSSQIRLENTNTKQMFVIEIISILEIERRKVTFMNIETIVHGIILILLFINTTSKSCFEPVFAENGAKLDHTAGMEGYTSGYFFSVMLGLCWSSLSLLLLRYAQFKLWYYIAFYDWVFVVTMVYFLFDFLLGEFTLRKISAVKKFTYGFEDWKEVILLVFYIPKTVDNEKCYHFCKFSIKINFFNYFWTNEFAEDTAGCSSIRLILYNRKSLSFYNLTENFSSAYFLL